MFAAALWWGSLSVVGLLVVPMLFRHLATPALAGQMAAKLFAAQAGLSLVCGLVLLACARASQRPAAWAGRAMGWVLAGMLLAALLEFAVAPRITARENLKLWHAVGSAMYLAQWFCAAVVLWKVSGVRTAGET